MGGFKLYAKLSEELIRFPTNFSVYFPVVKLFSVGETFPWPLRKFVFLSKS